MQPRVGKRFNQGMHRLQGFWLGVIALWLTYGVVYVVFRGGVHEDTRIVNLTVGEVLELLVLVVLWPLEVLGVSIQIAK